MAFKRAREEDREDAHKAPAKKSRVNTDLAKIWEQLADEVEEVRLDAASELLQNHLSTHDVETARTVAKRLFRGLCSSRKAARLGFYVALVGALSTKPGPFGLQESQLHEILSILEQQTRPEAGTSGQDERDHNFGRLMACKAVLDSNVLLNLKKDHDTDYDKFSEILCSLMADKPWLRPEITSTLVTALRKMASASSIDTSKASKFITAFFKRLKEHKLLRTIDSVGLWLLARNQFSAVDLPRDVWTKNDPLNAKDVQDLKRVLLDQKSKVADEDEILGNSGWSPTLHSVWHVILRDLTESKAKNRVTFAQFWQNIVENGHFHPSSTPERKHTGLLVLQTALEQVNVQDIPVCFSPNVIATLVHSLMKKDETYLFNTASTVLLRMKTHTATSDKSRGHSIILGLIRGSNYIDFDTVTKSTILNDLICAVGIDDTALTGKIMSWAESPPTTKDHESGTESIRKNLLNICQRAVCQTIRAITDDENKIVESQKQDQVVLTVQQMLIMKRNAMDGVLDLPFQPPTIEFLKEKIASIMEVLLTTGTQGQRLFLRLPLVLKKSSLQAEEDIKKTVKRSWSAFEKAVQASFLSTTTETNGTDIGSKIHHKKRMTVSEGFALLFAVLLQEAYDGDGDSIEILQDVLSASKEYEDKGNLAKAAGQITEIVLSLASRSSRLYRRAGALIFEAFCTHMSSDSLESLCDVITSKENREGQQELFEADVDENLADDTDNDSQEGSSASEELDSDVEVIENGAVDDDENLPSNDGETDSNTTSDAESDKNSEADSDEQDEELNNFEAALAKALGTRKLNQDDFMNMDDESESSETSDSDADMSDSEMVELDDKLAELFRNQQSQLSTQKLRKERMKTAKESVVNLKNRALDLIELFLRFEQKRAVECTQLLIATFQMATSTNSQQLTNRGVDIIGTFVRKCKGSKLPIVSRDKETRSNLDSRLATLHEYLLSTGQPTKLSNALIEVASSLNVLLCRLLYAAGHKNVVEVVERVSEDRKFGKDDDRQATTKFWAHFDQWVTSSGQRTEAEKPPQSAKTSTINGVKTKDNPVAESTKTKKAKKEKAKSRSK